MGKTRGEGIAFSTEKMWTTDPSVRSSYHNIGFLMLVDEREETLGRSYTWWYSV